MKSPLIPFNIEGSEDPAFMREVEQALQVLTELEALEAGENQLAIAQHNHAHAPQRAIEGLGPLVLSMDPTAHIFYRLQQFDFQSQKDLRWLTQRHPEMAVRGKQTTKDSFGWVPGLGKAEGRMKNEEVKGATSTLSTTAARNIRETTTYTS